MSHGVIILVAMPLVFFLKIALLEILPSTGFEFQTHVEARGKDLYATPSILNVCKFSICLASCFLFKVDMNYFAFI